MTNTLSKRHIVLLLGVIGGLAALAIDDVLKGHQLAIAQMIFWTLLLFAFVTIQVHKSLGRPRQLCVALVLISVHIIVLMRLRNYFPLHDLTVSFIGIPVAVILIFLYARVGQSVDPQGPFGLTEAEIRARKSL